MSYKLWELANRDGVVGLLPHVEEAVLRIAEGYESSALSTRVPSDVGEPIARFVHSIVWNSARPLRKGDPQPPPDSGFTHIAYPKESGQRDAFGELAMNRMVAQGAGGVIEGVALQRLANSLSRQLRYNHILQTTVGTGVAAYWVKAWPQRQGWEHKAYERKVDPKVEKRIEEESHTPVIVAYSSKAIIGTLPDEIGPEWAAETISKLTKAFDVLSLKYSDIKAQYHEAKAEAEKLASEIEALTTDPSKAKWEAARERINSILHPEGAEESNGTA